MIVCKITKKICDYRTHVILTPNRVILVHKLKFVDTHNNVIHIIGIS